MRLDQIFSQAKPAATLWRGIQILGFSIGDAEEIRAMLSRIPFELLKWVMTIRYAPELAPKHGRYLPDENTILVNPHTFKLRQRFGVGPGWIRHGELMVIHEVGHSVYEHLDQSLKDQWLRLGGWVKGEQAGNKPAFVEGRPGWPPYTSKWTMKKGVKVPRYYSTKTPDECFADCFAFFLLDKPHQMAPTLSIFIRKIISGKVSVYPQVAFFGPMKK